MGFRLKRRGRLSREREKPSRLLRGDVNAVYARATRLMYNEQFDEAQGCLDYARTLNNHPKIQSAQGLIRMLRGDLSPESWQQGHPGVEDLASQQVVEPLWNGEQIPGEILFIGPGNLGIGDVICLGRLFAQAKRQSQAEVLQIGVQEGTARLFGGLEGPDVVMTRSTAENGFTHHLPLALLPIRCELTPAILSRSPYLHAEPGLIDKWRPTFDDRSVLHVGLHFATHQGHGRARERSIPLATLKPVFDVPGVRWYSLQYGAAQELQAFPHIVDLGNIDDPEARLVNTAAVISHLDLVIAVDSAISHLAGALGQPCWLLNMYFNAHYWPIGRADTPWYPRHRLFRQAQQGAWGPVVEEVRQALVTLVKF